MARVFISHSSLDGPLASEMQLWLTETGFEAPFLDTDPADGIAPGADWERTLYNELKRADALIIILTANWMNSKWCFVEFAQARAQGKPIYPLIETPAGDRIFAPDIQHLDLRSDRDGGLERLAKELWRVSGDIRRGLRLPKDRPPYPGLSTFQEEDAAIYFGRDDEIRQFIQNLRSQRVLGSCNVIAILGGSGSGKSSLLRAGVIPKLKQENRTWRVAPPWRLREKPIEALVTVLTMALGDAGAVADLAGRLISDPAAVLAECERLVRVNSGSAETQIVIAVDQFEEIFPLGATEAAAVWRILELISQRRSGFVLVLTLRSDFLDKLQSAPARKFDFVPFTLDPLPPARLMEIIRNPARIVNILVDDDFVHAIIRDAGERNALPLVAFVLREIYEAQAGKSPWTVQAYDALGDPKTGRNPIENAVRQAADRAIASVVGERNPADLVRSLFIPKLVRVNDEGRYTRQPANRDKLDPSSSDLVDALIAARLLATSEDTGVRMVEVAHEALFTAWDLLATVLRDQHAFLLGIQQLASDQAEWAEAIKAGKQGDLLTGLRLARAREWFEAGRLEGELRDFVERSIAAADASARRRRFLRLAAVVGGIIVLLALGAVLYFMNEGSKAAIRAEAAHLVTTATTDIEKGQFPSAARNAVHAYNLAPGNETRSLLLDLMFKASGHLAETRSLGPIGPTHVAWSPDGQRVIAAGNSGQFFEWRVGSKNAAPLGVGWGRDPSAVSRIVAGPLAVGWDAAGRLIAIASDGKLTRDNSGGAVSVTLPLPSGEGVSVASADAAGSGLLAIAKVSDGQPLLFDTDGRPKEFENKCRGRIEGSGFTSALALSRDGSRLVIGTDDGWICSLNRANPAEEPRVQQTGSAVTAIAISSTGKQLAARLADGRLMIAGSDLSEQIFHTAAKRQGNVLAWSRAGLQFASLCYTDSLCISSIGEARSGGVRIAAEFEGAGQVQAVAWSPDDQRIASVDASGVLAIWTIKPDPVSFSNVMARSSNLTSLAVAPGGTLAAGTANGELALLDLNRGTVLRFPAEGEPDNENAIVALAAHPTQPSLVVVRRSGRVSIRHLPDGSGKRDYDFQSINPLRAATWLGASAKLAVAASSDLVLFDTNLDTREEFKTPPGSGDIQAAVFDAVNGQVLTTGNDDRLLAWSFGQTRAVTPFEMVPVANPLLRGRSVLALTPRGSRVALAGNDGQILVYDVSKKTVVQRFPVGFPVDDAAYSSDEKWLVSIRPDGWVELWNTDVTTAPHARARLQSIPRNVVYVADQNAFAIGDNAGFVHMIRMDPEAWSARSQRLAAD